MKIRTGFVSNSSSSSFCIYGTQLYLEDIKKYMPNELDTSVDGWEYEIDWHDLEIKLKHDIGEEMSIFYDYECADIYVGREVTSIEDDETGKMFKKSVEEKINQAFDTKYECHFIEETVQS